MRLKLAILVIVVCGVGFVLHERKSALEHHLSQIATQLGSRHVHVHCQSFASNLVDVSAEAGTVQFDQSGIPSDTTDLKRPICAALARFPHDVTSAGYACVYTNADCPQNIWEDVLAVHTLAHETWHLHGIMNEAQTECYALQTTARAAELFGASPAAAQATANYAYVRFYPNLPDEYRQAPCGNSGPLDLRPTDPTWP
jgi:hypothetical protein